MAIEIRIYKETDTSLKNKSVQALLRQNQDYKLIEHTMPQDADAITVITPLVNDYGRLAFLSMSRGGRRLCNVRTAITSSMCCNQLRWYAPPTEI